ncbi:type II toxin-antitoxin system RelE/ParE family toxin [Acetobacter malorum]|uniref:type II toxin-antitoxin system RelE/ParE family toxin n=1 Tax=Acetobacter malorum TaxID=178901 RepID=UPI0009EEAA19|nr:type II toxin-antitoxin system RelE/ParE family toxin [Acetobacter malorum]
MKELYFTPSAEDDLSNIWDYTVEKWSIEQADKYTDEIKEVCSDLCAGIKFGRSVEVRDGYLKYPSRSHVIYFLLYDDRLEVVRILGKRQDVDLNLPK